MTEAADLRVNFLKTLDLLCDGGHEASLSMYDGSKQTGKLHAVDKNFDQLGLRDFTTPLGTLKTALVRTTDVICLSIPADKVLEDCKTD